MDHEIRQTKSETSRRSVPPGAEPPVNAVSLRRTRVVIHDKSPIAPVETAVSRALRGVIPR